MANETELYQQEFLKDIREKLRRRIQELKASILEGQKDIESMHEYYW